MLRHRFLLFVWSLSLVPAIAVSALSVDVETTSFKRSASCDETYVSNRGQDSPNYQYFHELLEQGANAPLKSFLTLWYPDRGDGSDLDSSFFGCEESTVRGFAVSVRPNGSLALPPEVCRPDLLYSWGSAAKAKDVMTRLADGVDWPTLINPNSKVTLESDQPSSPRYGLVYTSMSPASTFGYGEVLLRFKIKPGVRYEFFSQLLSDPALAVAVGWHHEFNFRHSAIVESVSMGTPEIYDEVVRDILRFESGKRVFVYSNWDLNDRTKPVPYEASGIDRLYRQNVDHHLQTEERLKANLLELIREILKGEGRVHYSKGTCRSRAAVFSTRFPSFIQPALTH